MADTWYYTCDEQPQGPIAVTALRAMAAGGTLKPTDLVWTEGMSQWAPASMTRGLFSTPLPAPPANRAAAPPLSAAPRQEPHTNRHDDDFLRQAKRSRPQRRQAGMSTGARAVIALSIAGFVGLVLVGGALVVEILCSPPKLARSKSAFPAPPVQRPNPAFQGGGRGFGAKAGGPVANPPMQPPKGPIFGGGAGGVAIPGGPGAIPSNGEFTIDLNFKGEKVDHLVQFKAGEIVHITVTTTKWGGAEEPDVDLCVFDPNGRLVVQDTRPFKDCDVIFRTPIEGQYKVQVNLDQGAWAQCTVRY